MLLCTLFPIFPCFISKYNNEFCTTRIYSSIDVAMLSIINSCMVVNRLTNQALMNFLKSEICAKCTSSHLKIRQSFKYKKFEIATHADTGRCLNMTTYQLYKLYVILPYLAGTVEQGIAVSLLRRCCTVITIGRQSCTRPHLRKLQSCSLDHKERRCIKVHRLLAPAPT